MSLAANTEQRLNVPPGVGGEQSFFDLEYHVNETAVHGHLALAGVPVASEVEVPAFSKCTESIRRVQVGDRRTNYRRQLRTVRFGIAVFLTSIAIDISAESETNIVPLSRVNVAKLLQEEPACHQVAPKFWQCESTVELVDKSNVDLDGEGARIEFLDPSRGKGGLKLVRGRNVRLSRIEIGWTASPRLGPPIQSLGRAVGCPGGVRGAILDLDTQYTGTSPLGAVSAWDDRHGWTWFKGGPDAPDVYFPSGTTVRFDQGRSECIPQLANQVGRRVIARLVLGTNHAFTCVDCKDVTLEGIRVTSAPGMAFVFDRNASNVVLRRNVIAPACHPNCKRAAPSVSQDGVHIAGAQGPVVIEDNDFGWQGDDSVNITGLLVAGRAETHSPAENPSLTRLLVDPRWRARMFQFRANAVVTLYDFGLNVLGHARVSSVGRNLDFVDLADAPAVNGEVVIAADDRVPTNVLVRNNHFHDHRARGILIGAAHAVIEGNVIERLTMQGILVGADTGISMEGPGATDLLIRGNVLSHVNRYPEAGNYPSAISVGLRSNPLQPEKVGRPIQSVRIEANSFLNLTSNSDQPVSFGRGVIKSSFKAQ